MTPAQVYALSGAGLQKKRKARKAARQSDPIQFAMLTRMPWKG